MGKEQRRTRRDAALRRLGEAIHLARPARWEDDARPGRRDWGVVHHHLQVASTA